MVGRYEIFKTQFPEIAETFFHDTQGLNTWEGNHTERTGLLSGNEQLRIGEVDEHGSIIASVDE